MRDDRPWGSWRRAWRRVLDRMLPIARRVRFNAPSAPAPRAGGLAGGGWDEHRRSSGGTQACGCSDHEAAVTMWAAAVSHWSALSVQRKRRAPARPCASPPTRRSSFPTGRPPAGASGSAPTVPRGSRSAPARLHDCSEGEMRNGLTLFLVLADLWDTPVGQRLKNIRHFFACKLDGHHF